MGEISREPGAQDSTAGMRREMMEKKNLMYAAMTGNLGAVRELLDGGADPNAVYVRGMTALMAASMEGHEEIVGELLSHGADPNAEYETGGPAL